MMSDVTMESVWDYPRPPRVEAFHGRIEIIQYGITVATTTRAQRVLETSHPPVYYLPKDDILMDYLYETDRKTVCEFKGVATYWGMLIKGKRIDDVAWSYENPRTGYDVIKGHLAFYAGKMEECYVNGERVMAQEGHFYGGWITSNISGPFKGGPGTVGW
jgi:uncharacterized protein (DUF427 family)